MDLRKHAAQDPRTQRRRSDDNLPSDRRHPDAMEARMDIFEEKLDANTAITKRSVEMFEGIEAGIKVLGALGTFAKWLVPIITLGVTLWAVLTGKDLPHK